MNDNKFIHISEAVNGYVITISEEVDLDFLLSSGQHQQMVDFAKKVGAAPSSTRQMVARDKDELLKQLQALIGAW